MFDKSQNCLEKDIKFIIAGQNTPPLFDENPLGVDSINIHVDNLGEKNVLLIGLSCYNITFLLENARGSPRRFSWCSPSFT